MERAMLPDADNQQMLPPDDDQQMLQISMVPEQMEQPPLTERQQVEKSVLPDEHRRAILFAFEYAMLAILDRSWSHFPVPPPVTDAVMDKFVRDIKAGIPRHVPVPRDWEPSLKLPQKMFDTQSCWQLHSNMCRLQRIISKQMYKHNSGNPYLGEAHKYLSRAGPYLVRAQFKASEVILQRHMARMEKLRAERLRKSADEAEAQQPIEK